ICQRYIDISLSDTPHISARYMSTPRSCARAQNARSSPQTRLQTRPTRGNFGLARDVVGRQADRPPLLLVAGRALQLRRDVVYGVGAKLNSLGKLIVRGEVHDDLGGLYRVAILAVVGVARPGTGGTARRSVVVALRFGHRQAAAVKEVRAKRARLDGHRLDSQRRQLVGHGFRTR